VSTHKGSHCRTPLRRRRCSRGHWYSIGGSGCPRGSRRRCGGCGCFGCCRSCCRCSGCRRCRGRRSLLRLFQHFSHTRQLRLFGVRSAAQSGERRSVCSRRGGGGGRLSVGRKAVGARVERLQGGSGHRIRGRARVGVVIAAAARRAVGGAENVAVCGLFARRFVRHLTGSRAEKG
jgi:hypothetical protein